MNFDEHLHIRETADRGAGEWQIKTGGDSFCQRAIAVAGNNFHKKGFRVRPNFELRRGLAMGGANVH